MNLGQKVVDLVVLVHKLKLTLLHLLLAPLPFPLQVVDLLVLCNLKLLKLMSLNSGGTLYRPQKDTMPK
jgi:hypothetical protein